MAGTSEYIHIFHNIKTLQAVSYAFNKTGMYNNIQFTSPSFIDIENIASCTILF